MDGIELLLVDDDPGWQGNLVDDIRRACAEEAICIVDPAGEARTYPALKAPAGPGPSRSIKVFVAGKYEQARDLLAGRKPWKLLVTDLSLAANDMSGMRLAQQAREQGVPCLAVSGSRVTGLDHVSELYRDYRIYDFFNKLRFDGHRFRGHIRNILDPPPPAVSSLAGPGSSPPPPDAVAQPREVRIEARGAGCIALCSEGLPTYLIPGEYAPLFACFAYRASLDVPGERVDHRELNEAVGKRPIEKATGILKSAIYTFNKRLADEFGPTPNGKRWILNRQQRGYSLNTAQLRWTVDLVQMEPVFTLYGLVSGSIRAGAAGRNIEQTPDRDSP